MKSNEVMKIIEMKIIMCVKENIIIIVCVCVLLLLLLLLLCVCVMW